MHARRCGQLTWWARAARVRAVARMHAGAQPRHLALADEPSDAAPADGAVPHEREVLDWVTRSVWCVGEHDASAGDRAPRYLRFRAGAAEFRVWTYPAGWAALPDGALMALIDGDPAA